MDIEEKLSKILYFDSDALKERVAEAIAKGESVILEVKLYLGAGKWKLDKHRYKMIVPVMDKNGKLYSTDVYKTVALAISGSYGIYVCTQQYATEMICSIKSDLSDAHFAYGYTQEKYGRIPVVKDDSSEPHGESV